MEKISKELFNYLWNLHEAIDLAYDLGYAEGGIYYYEEECLNEMRKKITSLVGDKWPEEVIDSYNTGSDTAWIES